MTVKNAKATNTIRELTDNIFSNSVFVNKDKIMAILSMPAARAVEGIKNDLAHKLYKEWSTLYNERVSALTMQTKRKSIRYSVYI